METQPIQFATEADLEAMAGFNRTRFPFPDRVTLQELIEERVRAQPADLAVVCDHDKAFGAEGLTYDQLNAKANQLAHRLRAEGVVPGAIVGLRTHRSFEMILGILGILKAGGAYLPLAPDLPGERARFMLENGRVRILLTQGDLPDSIRFEGVEINLSDPGVFRGSTTNPDRANRSDDLAYVIYTSGSTGKPKGVMIEHRSVVNRLHWMQHAYPLGPDDVILQKTPYYFDVSVWELFWWALYGAKLCFLQPGGEGIPLVIADTVRKHRVTVLHFVPSMLNVFLEYWEGKEARIDSSLGSIRRVFASGEALSPRHVNQFNRLIGRRTGARLVNLYGPTEATVDVSYYDCPDHEKVDKVPIGRPIHNTRFEVLQEGRRVALGETGELCIAGVGLARGYLNHPALTAEKFIDNPANPGERVYRTGDLVRWLPDGNLEYLGREDHQVKIRGLRIELGEIEAMLRECPGVADCVVIVKSYTESIRLIVAYVVCKTGAGTDEIKGQLRRSLPEYMVPNHIERLDRIPLTPSGKADRKALPEPRLHEPRV